MIYNTIDVPILLRAYKQQVPVERLVPTEMTFHALAWTQVAQSFENADLPRTLTLQMGEIDRRVPCELTKEKSKERKENVVLYVKTLPGDVDSGFQNREKCCF